MIALELPQGPPDPAFLAALAARQPERLPGYVAWQPSRFEVDSGGPIDAGIDGEAVRLPPPLRFTIRPGALRIRLPRQASGLSLAARELQRRARLREVPAPRIPRIRSSGAAPHGLRRGSERLDG